jgi:hypothetical protein
VFSITGLVRFLPDSLEPQFRHWIRVPHILLHVDKIELSGHSDDPVRVTPTVFFSQEDDPAHAEGEKGNVTYATCRDDHAEISEAADWLAWYAEKFHGEIITNFDQQSPIFQDAPFSLQNLWAGRIRKETLDRFGFEESEELVGAVMRIIKRSTGPTYQISGGTVAIGPGAQAITNTAGKDQAMTTASWVFGSVLVLFLIAFVFWNPATLPGPQQMVVRLLGSVFAGLISAFFVGTMHLQATVRKIQIAAVGGFAAFCLVFLLWK